MSSRVRATKECKRLMCVCVCKRDNLIKRNIPKEYKNSKMKGLGKENDLLTFYKRSAFLTYVFYPSVMSDSLRTLPIRWYKKDRFFFVYNDQILFFVILAKKKKKKM